MSADGNVEIAVRAEGADDAAEELAQGADAQGGGKGRGGLAASITGGIVGGLLAQGLGPILDLLDPILKILQAFLAPVAALLMRALAPVLREIIKLLPQWNAFVSDAPGLLGDIVSFIQSLPDRIAAFMRDPLGAIEGWLQSAMEWLADRFNVDSLLSLARDAINRFLEKTAEMASIIADGIAAGLRKFFGADKSLVGDVSQPPENRTQQVTRGAIAQGASSVFGPLGPAARPVIELGLSGGLGPLVDAVEAELGFDW